MLAATIEATEIMKEGMSSHDMVGEDEEAGCIISGDVALVESNSLRMVNGSTMNQGKDGEMESFECDGSVSSFVTANTNNDNLSVKERSERSVPRRRSLLGNWSIRSLHDSYVDQEEDLEVAVPRQSSVMSERLDDYSLRSVPENGLPLEDRSAYSLSGSRRNSIPVINVYDPLARRLSLNSHGSVRSLVSVVAEMVGNPIRFATAVVADLEYECYDEQKNARPEFLSISLLKEGDDAGIEFERKENMLRICSIASDGPFAKTPLHVGDRLVSINNITCRKADEPEVAEMLRKISGRLTVVVHNVGGNPELVQSMITKPLPTSKTGLGLKSTARGVIKISSIDPKGEFGDSILGPGDGLISINGNSCQHHTSTTAALIISQSPDTVSLLVRSHHETAVVLAEGSARHFSMEMATVVETDEPDYRRERSNVGGVSRDGTETTAQHIGTWFSGLYAAIVTLVSLFICTSLDATATMYGIVIFGGFCFGYLLQLPWRFRSHTSRVSASQLFCDALLVMAFFMLMVISPSLSAEVYFGVIVGVILPSVMMVNLPTFVLKPTHPIVG